MPNLINAERLRHGYGTRTLLGSVSVGLGVGEAVGVVGRNGDGKTTLLQILTGALAPDAGRVTRTRETSVGYLHQADNFAPDATVRDVLVAGAPDHVWAAQPATRAVVRALLGDVGLDTPVGSLSGGERRRSALAGLLLADPDVLVLDEPTNHLDVEAVDWLARELRARQERGRALLVVSHDRWFLDAVCTRIWEVHDGTVDAYEGGYAAYVLARAERARQAAGAAARRRNLLRKELAWLHRGAPARTSKPRFRLDAAAALIADEPPPRDSRELAGLASRRLGKDVFDLTDVTLTVPAGGRSLSSSEGRTLLDHLSWSIGPGERIGLVGVNGSGKTSLLRLLTGELTPDSGSVRRGRTLAVGHLTQAVAELRGPARVLDSVEEVRRLTRLASGQEVSATSLLEDFGFRRDKLTARLGDLSGGERRRLQLLRLLLGEPNVLLLDEPTNDLDIDTLTVVEDFLDSWPGTLVVVTHDRYFLERVCDVTYGLRGDGSCVLLPGGVEQYLAERRTREADAVAPVESVGTASGAERRRSGKELAVVERRLDRVGKQMARIHADLAAHDPSDYPGLTALTEQLSALQREEADLETQWLELAEQAG